MAAIIRPTVLLALLVVVMAPTEAAAQNETHLAVGGTLSTKLSGDSAPGRVVRPALMLLQGPRDGWNWKFGLNWYSAEVEPDGGADQRLTFGKLNVRPIMAGYGYSRVAGRATVSAHFLAGYAFTSFSLPPPDAARANLGTLPITVNASNALVLRPEMSAWVDLGHRVGLNISAGYMVARPVLTVRTPEGEDRRRMHADRLLIKVGLGYAVF
jgi:hypothetical protein